VVLGLFWIGVGVDFRGSADGWRLVEKGESLV